MVNQWRYLNGGASGHLSGFPRIIQDHCPISMVNLLSSASRAPKCTQVELSCMTHVDLSYKLFAVFSSRFPPTTIQLLSNLPSGRIATLLRRAFLQIHTTHNLHLPKITVHSQRSFQVTL